MLLRQTLLYLPAQIVGPLFQFVAVVAWTHFLSPHDMGVFALVAAAQELVYTIVLFWFSLYTLRYYDPQSDANARAAYLNTESAVLLTTAVVTGGGLLLLPMLIEGEWSWGLIGAAIAYSITRGAVSQYSDRARAEHDSLSYSVLQIFWPVFGLILGLLFVQVLEPNTTSVLLGYAVAQAASLIIAFWRLGFGRAPRQVSTVVVANAVRYGLPLVGGAILIWFANNGIRFVVEHQTGAAAVGLLTVGWGLGLRATSFASMLTTAAAFPVAMKRARDGGLDEGQAQLERNGVLLLATLAPIALGLWVIAEPLVRLIVAQEYREITMSVLPLAVAAGAVRSFRIHFGEQVFMLREAPMVPLINDGIDAVASLAGSYAGLLLAGLPGSVAGCAAAAVFSLVITMLWGWWRYRFSMSLDAFLRITASVAAMTITVYLMPVSATVIGVGMAVAVGALTYFAALSILFPEGRSMILAAARRPLDDPTAASSPSSVVKDASDRT